MLPADVPGLLGSDLILFMFFCVKTGFLTSSLLDPGLLGSKSELSMGGNFLFRDCRSFSSPLPTPETNDPNEFSWPLCESAGSDLITCSDSGSGTFSLTLTNLFRRFSLSGTSLLISLLILRRFFWEFVIFLGVLHTFFDGSSRTPILTSLDTVSSWLSLLLGFSKFAE